MDYQWYPGHMTKARRMMQENIGLVDLVIELADARIPLSSRNPDIDTLCGNKARILLMTKADMADPARTALFQQYFEDRGFMVIAMDARTRKANDKIKAYVEKACAAKRERDKRRGIVGRPLRAMVVGIPNVGKSTFINSFAGKASAKTGNKPGVTRGKQWIRLNKNLELLDTPGILWPKFEDRQVGVNLALTGAIRQELLEEQELSLELLDFLQREYPSLLVGRYAPEGEESKWELPMDNVQLLTQIALARNLLKAGGEPVADIRVRTSRLRGTVIEGDLIVANFDDEFRTQFLGWAANTNGGIGPVKNAVKPNIYIAFELKGSSEKRRIIFYGGSTGPVNREFNTVDGTPEPATDTLPVSFVGDNVTGKLYDIYRGRVIFPIHNDAGKIIGFGGRILIGSKNHGKEN